MSAVASLSVSHVAAHAAVTSRSSRATSASSSTFPRRVNDSQRKTSQSRRSSRMHAVSEPVTIPAAPSGGEQDPAIAAYIADQMIDEAVMLASSTFPIAPEVRGCNGEPLVLFLLAVFLRAICPPPSAGWQQEQEQARAALLPSNCHSRRIRFHRRAHKVPP